MNLRFFIFCLILFFFSSLVLAAANPAWDCEQGKNGEWICKNQETGNSKPINTTPTKSVPVESKSDATSKIVTEPSPKQDVQNVTPEPILEVKPLETAVKQPEIPKIIAVPDEDKTVEKPIEPAKKTHVNVTQNLKTPTENLEPVPDSSISAQRQAGWKCESGAVNQNWNCNLVGPDPKGNTPQLIEATENEFRFFPPSFNNNQENSFAALRSEYKVDPWLNCGSWATRKPKHKAINSAERENAPTDVMADFSEAYQAEVLNFAGHVDLTRADQHLLAENVSYDTKAQTMDAQGNVIYREGTLAFASDTAMMNLNSSQARLRNAMFIVGDGPLRGTAEAIYRDNEYLSRINETAFTSCPPGNQDWVMHASRLKINRESGQGSAKDAWMEFKGTPVFYTPYISFPTDNRRLSGFLAPSWGTTQRSGFNISAPFYWNIAPNLDTVITPRYYSGRGEMVSNKLRYLTESSKGSFGAEFLPNDQKLNKARYSMTFKDVSNIAPNLASDINLNLVSDKTYFTDLNTALGFNRSSYLPSIASLNYNTPGVNFSTVVQHYQAVDPYVLNTAIPYDILPKLSLNLNHTFEDFPLKVQMDNQYAEFHHNVLVNGQRLMLWPSVSMPLQSSAGFFTPKISVQSTQYLLSNQSSSNETVIGQPSSINRTLPILSLDTGLTFEKAMDFSGTSYTNLIEPRLFYLYIPRKNQDNIPVFDTSAYDINFNSLFRENSYSGYDRLQDANQITVAATTRFIDNNTGLEPLKASLGSILYFQDRKVTLPYLNPNISTQPNVPYDFISTQTSRASNLIGEFSGQLNQNLSYSTLAQLNTATNSLARGQAVLKFRNQPNQIFDIGYRYRSASANPLVPTSIVPGTTSTPANINLTDVSFRWPIYDQWYAMGRWQYSLNFDKTTESFIGIEKESCCWRLRFIARRYINGATTNSFVNANVTPQTGFFVELELKGLSGFGDDVDYFLQTALNGYRPTSSNNN